MENNENLMEIEKLSYRPFTKFCMSIGAVPSTYLASMTIPEQMLWLSSYIENQIVPTVNNNAEAVEELQNLYEELHSYVEHYFDNLDVQEEINNKLDDMVEAGTLQKILTDYFDKKIYYIDTVSSMLSAEYLKENDYVTTEGYYSANDGGQASYIIVDTIPSEKHYETLENGLYAELLSDDKINALQIGCKINDDSFDNGAIITSYISKLSTKLIDLYFPTGIYYFTTNLKITSRINITGDGHENTYFYDKYDGNLPFIQIGETTRIATIELKDFSIIGNYQEHIGLSLIKTGFTNVINNLRIRYYKHQGLLATLCYDTICNDLEILDCGSYSNGNVYYGLEFRGDGNDTTNAWHINGLHIEKSRYMMKATNTHNMQISNSKFESANFIVANVDPNDNTHAFIYLGDRNINFVFNSCDFTPTNRYALNTSLGQSDSWIPPYYVECSNSSTFNMGYVLFNGCTFLSVTNGGFMLKANYSNVTNCIFRLVDPGTSTTKGIKIYGKQSKFSNNTIYGYQSKELYSASVDIDGATCVNNTFIAYAWRQTTSIPDGNYPFIYSSTNQTVIDSNYALSYAHQEGLAYS